MVRNSLIISAIALGAATTAQAGSLADPAVEAAPTPVAVVPVVAPTPRGNDWTGFYAGAQLGYGQLESDAFDEDAEDLLYGVHAGYNYDFGNFVIGGEIDYDWTQISDSGSSIDLDNVARLKLRAGYDAGEFLPYVTVGAARAFTGGALDANDDGQFFGVGLDYQVGSNLRVGGEVLRHEFEDFDGSGADIEATTFAARVSYNF